MSNKLPLEDGFYPPFEGFHKEGIDFLRKLKKNNNRPWFNRHKEEYEENVKFPMQCLIALLAQRMVDAAPEIEFNPRRSIFRIYRDIRFSKNKAPYKTNVAASFELRGRRGRTETPGLYIHIEPGEVFVGGGLYMPTGEQLKAIRHSITNKPEEFLEVTKERRFKKEFGSIQGERLQKAPLGFPKDHPMIEHLRLKQFFVYKTFGESVCFKARFPDTVASVFADIMPLIRWLAKAVS